LHIHGVGSAQDAVAGYSRRGLRTNLNVLHLSGVIIHLTVDKTARPCWQSQKEHASVITPRLADAGKMNGRVR
jgi:hypothetical protein